LRITPQKIEQTCSPPHQSLAAQRIFEADAQYAQLDAQRGKAIEVRKSDLAATHSQPHHVSAMLGDGAKRRRFWMYDRTEGERLPTRGGGTWIAGLSSTMSDVERSAADAFVTTGRSPIHPAYSLELLGFDAGGVMCITMAERHFAVLIKIPFRAAALASGLRRWTLGLTRIAARGR
jgi:hypothetical protein